MPITYTVRGASPVAIPGSGGAAGWTSIGNITDGAVGSASGASATSVYPGGSDAGTPIALVQGILDRDPQVMTPGAILHAYAAQGWQMGKGAAANSMVVSIGPVLRGAFALTNPTSYYPLTSTPTNRPALVSAPIDVPALVRVADVAGFGVRVTRSSGTSATGGTLTIDAMDWTIYVTPGRLGAGRTSLPLYEGSSFAIVRSQVARADAAPGATVAAWDTPASPSTVTGAASARTNHPQLAITTPSAGSLAESHLNKLKGKRLRELRLTFGANPSGTTNVWDRLVLSSAAGVGLASATIDGHSKYAGNTFNWPVAGDEYGQTHVLDLSKAGVAGDTLAGGMLIDLAFSLAKAGGTLLTISDPYELEVTWDYAQNVVGALASLPLVGSIPSGSAPAVTGSTVATGAWTNAGAGPRLVAAMLDLNLTTGSTGATTPSISVFYEVKSGATTVSSGAETFAWTDFVANIAHGMEPISVPAGHTLRLTVATAHTAAIVCDGRVQLLELESAASLPVTTQDVASALATALAAGVTLASGSASAIASSTASNLIARPEMLPLALTSKQIESSPTGVTYRNSDTTVAATRTVARSGDTTVTGPVVVP